MTAFNSPTYDQAYIEEFLKNPNLGLYEVNKLSENEIMYAKENLQKFRDRQLSHPLSNENPLGFCKREYGDSIKTNLLNDSDDEIINNIKLVKPRIRVELFFHELKSLIQYFKVRNTLKRFMVIRSHEEVFFIENSACEEIPDRIEFFELDQIIKTWNNELAHSIKSEFLKRDLKINHFLYEEPNNGNMLYDNFGKMLAVSIVICLVLGNRKTIENFLGQFMK